MPRRDGGKSIWATTTLALAGAVLIGTGCHTGTPAPVELNGPAAALAEFAGLPDLPPAGPPGRVPAQIDYTFSEADVWRQQQARWDEDELTLVTVGLSYAILGCNVGEATPTQIVLDGQLNKVWLGLSDYGNGGWRWIGEYSYASLVTVPAGDFINDDGMTYVALVCPSGADALLTVTLGLPGEPDVSPPEWQGGVGIISAEMHSSRVTLSWHPAIDAESPPVEYLIYRALTENGIDWEERYPISIVAADYTSTTIFLGDQQEVSFDFAVQARDAVGNITDNTNFVSTLNVDDYLLPIVPWSPGDKLVMTGPEATQDLSILLSYQSPLGWVTGASYNHGALEGLINFSPDNFFAGTCEEWVQLRENSPAGAWLVGSVVSGGSEYVTIEYRLLNDEGQLIHDFGSVTGGGPMPPLTYLAKGSWPCDLDWQPGDRFEISWPDPNADLRLFIYSPGGGFGTPGSGDLLLEQIEFSLDSADSGATLEWAKLLPGGLPGAYEVALDWGGYDGAPPASVPVSMRLLDAADQVKAEVGIADMPPDGWLDVVARLHNSPE